MNTIHFIYEICKEFFYKFEKFVSVKYLEL